ncbi:hypothetical protein LTR17_019637 [Elasticomyces elasticus]|nr:hypothetical protein LTR17_019637 [Elasticomyces elasticus]
MSLRGTDYFDEISFQKFAITYLMDIALFQTGQHNLARMLEVECLQLGRLLHLHRIEEYEGLNNIEIQLRKKGFWLLFYSFVHSEVQNLRKERLSFLDPELLSSIDLEALMPKDTDDEAIFEDHIVERSCTEPCLTTGYNIHSQVFWAAVRARGPTSANHHSMNECHCIHARDPQGQIEHLLERLHDLKYTLHAVPNQLRQWTLHSAHLNPGVFADSLEIVLSQFGAMRVNVHVTHLWLQSILLDRLEAILHDSRTILDPSRLLATVHARWSEREAVCSQLLHVLHAVSEEDIEPNGLHLAYKVRDVAVGLLACPYEPHELPSLRAMEYVREFTDILARLDTFETVTTTNLQTWIDTDRERGRRSRENIEHMTPN